MAKMVPCLKGVHPDDAFSVIPYEKGSLFLYYLENKYGRRKYSEFKRKGSLLELRKCMLLDLVCS